MATEIVFVDHFAHVAANLVGGGDWGAGPRLEPVTERVQIAVGPCARVTMGEPGATEVGERIENRKRSLRALLGQVVRSADTRDPSADDQHVEVFDLFVGVAVNC